MQTWAFFFRQWISAVEALHGAWVDIGVAILGALRGQARAFGGGEAEQSLRVGVAQVQGDLLGAFRHFDAVLAGRQALDDAPGGFLGGHAVVDIDVGAATAPSALTATPVRTEPGRITLTRMPWACSTSARRASK